MATPEYWNSEGASVLRGRLQSVPDLVDASLLEELADADSPRGLIAVTTLPLRSVETLDLVRRGLYLYLDEIQDPGNLGAVARVAEAAGASALILGPGTTHPNHPRALRASAGSLLRLATAVDTMIDSLSERLRPIDAVATGLVPRGGVDVFDPAAPLDGAVLLMLGSEGAGLKTSLSSLADVHLTVPMEPPVESLNVATAAAIVAYEWRRRRLTLPG